MNETFEELVNRYKQELMRYLPAVPPSVPNAPPVLSSPPQKADSFPATCRSDLTDEGSLQIMLTTARQSLPLPDGYVTVTCRTDTGENLLYFLETNSDGRTALVPLPAPDRRLAETPNSSVPYAFYDVRADHSGYATVLVRNAQVFGGIVSDLPIETVPARTPTLLEFDLTAQTNLTEERRTTP